MISELSPSDPEYIFTTGAVWDKEHLDLVAKKESFGVLIRLIKGKFDIVDISFPPIALLSEKNFKRNHSESGQCNLITYYFGPEGALFKLNNEDVTYEIIDNSTNHKLAIRDAKMINGRPYAVGMSRQVYRCRDDYQWEHFDSGMMHESMEMNDVVGLQKLDAYNENDIYSVGLRGEIWHFNGSRWQQLDSPTNCNLNAVCCTPEYVYIAGASGIFLRGKNGNFEIIDHSMDLCSLHHLAWFNNKLYMSGSKNLFLYDGRTIKDVDFGSSDGITVGALHCNDGLLMSVGSKHILITEDGETWNQIFIER